MAIILSIDSSYEFIRAFEACNRGEQFHAIGFRALFDYLEAENEGQDYKLDPVDLCCDLTEYSLEECELNFKGLDEELIAEYKEAGDWDALEGYMQEYIEDNTTLVGRYTAHGETHFLFYAF